MQYEIGEIVAFIRENSNGDVVEGKGMIKGIGLCPHGHKIALIQTETATTEAETSKAVNAYLTALNPSDAFKDAFKRHVDCVAQIAEKAQQAQQEIVDQANQDIANARLCMAGKPLEQS